MTGSTRRILAILVSAALTASLATIALASDVDPAAKARKPKVKCDGVVATKVGTPRRDVIRGTAGKDVIAGLGGHDVLIGRGGNDILCGGAGNDRLVGGPGHDKLLGGVGRDRLLGGVGVDKLFGGPHNDVLAGQAGPDVLGGGSGADRLDGGVGVDLCNQGTGQGPMVRCELPRALFAPPAPPAPPAPVPTPEPKTLAIAYSDLNGVEGYQEGAGDVLIAKLVDTSRDGTPSPGDTITMGMYPENADPSLAEFSEWEVKTHTVEFVWSQEGNSLEVEGKGGGHHQWTTTAHMNGEVYREVRLGSQSSIQDPPWDQDLVHLENRSPSRPAPSWHDDFSEHSGDSPLIDVELRYGGSIL